MHTEGVDAASLNGDLSEAAGRKENRTWMRGMKATKDTHPCMMSVYMFFFSPVASGYFEFYQFPTKVLGC
ncbi:hypothetical protein BS47DRAFT_1337601 [Hydnum rufescens UP504]|uniref:Uncharacterized protein n=1 Tax=Hydnum rufescens UP504 TaxID=1448309 RepID=A0A9P6B7W6_9AGAM|nr:hypothetical protein BS47DRAFT_1337601 [Hydnum rufescens UP504]